MVNQKTIILGIAGGIAAYKCCDLTRRLIDAGAQVHVVLTKSGEKFITPLTLQTLSQHPVHTELFDLTQESQIGHIELADRADLVLVAPATADLIARVNAGICNDLLTTIIAATQAPVAFVPSMNCSMWKNKITQRNVAALKELGYLFLDPAEGSLACGYEGVGRLPDVDQILHFVQTLLK